MNTQRCFALDSVFKIDIIGVEDLLGPEWDASSIDYNRSSLPFFWQKNMKSAIGLLGPNFQINAVLFVV
jgi:hypothetical protein